MKNKNLIVLAILILTSVISLSAIISKRNSIERNNNQVEFIMEYSDVFALSNNSDLTVADWLSHFKEMGVISIAIGEQTLASYINEYGITYESLMEIKSRGSSVLDDYPEIADYDNYSLILYILEKERAEFLSESLSNYKYLEFTTIYEKDTNYIVINQNKSDVLNEESGKIFNDIGKNIGTIKYYYGTEVLNLPIGFDEYKVNLIKDANLEIMFRPINYEFDALGAWNLYLKEIDKYGLSNKNFFPYGEQLIGYQEDKDYINLVYDYIVENDLNFILVETVEQREHYELFGYDDFLKIIENDRIVRLFNTWHFISNRYQYLDVYDGPEEISNSFYRAITERNIRAIYLRPFSSDSIRIVTDPKEYYKTLDMLEVQLKKHGYSYGSATTFEDFSVSTTMKILLTIQVAGYLIVLLNYLLLTFKLKYNLALLAIISVLITLAYMIAPNTSTALSAFVSAVVFSSLATTVFIKECLIKVKYGNIAKSIIYTFLCGSIAIIGGLYIGSIMATTRYFLEFEYFRGVKLSLIFPILIIGFFTIIFYVKDIYAQKGNGFFSELHGTTKNFLNANIKVKYLIILGILGIIGLLYLARGSNTSSVEPLNIELLMRNFLENNLLARPRTKEFLIAFPLMTFSIFFAGNKYFYENKSENGIYFKYSYILFFAIIAAVGLASITNTFSHIRTPIYISIFRSIYGLGLGVVFGFIYIFVFKLLIIIGNKLLKIFSKFKGDFLA